MELLLEAINLEQCQFSRKFPSNLKLTRKYRLSLRASSARKTSMFLFHLQLTKHATFETRNIRKTTSHPIHRIPLNCRKTIGHSIVTLEPERHEKIGIPRQATGSIESPTAPDVASSDLKGRLAWPAVAHTCARGVQVVARASESTGGKRIRVSAGSNPGAPPPSSLPCPPAHPDRRFVPYRER